MAAEFKVPELGENVTSGDVLRVLVKVGDEVAKEQPVLELETDKATIEVPSSVSGTITEVAVKEGDKVNVGQVILRVEEAAVAAEPKRAAADIGVTREGPRPLPPGAAEEVAPKEPGKVVDISRGARPAAAAAEAQPPEPGLPVPAAPSVRRVARELGIDIRRVPGSGPGGRISEEDVKAFVRSRSLRGVAAAAAAPLPDISRWGAVERTPMSNVRRKTAEHLMAAWAAPHVTQHDKADITALEELRRKYSPRAEAAGGKLTITAIAVKVIAEAVKRFPQFNAALDLENEEIIYRKYVNVGVAVDTERGLLVPVIRDADRKTIIELSVEVANAAKKARDRKLGLDDMAGGGISITNLGGIGGTSFTPIINVPEGAILGMSRAEMQPVWRPASAQHADAGGSFEPRLMLPLSLSYDHRLIDGADAARFLRWVCEAFEQPLLLAL